MAEWRWNDVARPFDPDDAERIGYLYRPGECVVHADDDDDDLVREINTINDSPVERRFVASMNAVIYNLGSDDRMPQVLDEVRRRSKRVSRHIMLRGEPWYHGGAGAPPEPTSPAPRRRPDDAGANVRIAVLDTGISVDHEAFAGVDVHGVRPPFDDIQDDGGPDTRVDYLAGHGTFVTGVIVADAPGASISVVRTLDSHGWVTLADLCDDLQLAGTELEPQIINLSLGGYAEEGAEPVGLAHAIDELGRRNILVVAAAGNDNREDPFYPAALDRENVLSVGAVVRDSGDAFTHAPYTNHGSWVHVGAEGEMDGPFLTYHNAREGHGVDDEDAMGPTRFCGWARWSGTSFATPQVTAAVAVLTARSGRPPIEVASLMRQTLGKSPGAGVVVTVPDVDNIRI